MTKKIAQVVVDLPIEGPFDYLVKKSLSGKLAKGKRVYVPFHHRQLVGYVIGLKGQSRLPRLKPIYSLLDTSPSLDENILRLAKEFAGYYGCSWGEAISATLPSALRKKTPLELSRPRAAKRSARKGDILLCHDQGGEGRWDLIVGKIGKALAKKETVIFLVPEIALIDRVQTELRKHFSESIAVLDKKLTPKKELAQWISIKQGESRIVIGTRSAVFAPVSRPGLIIVYDEENSAFKQEQSPSYHVRDVALMRSKIEGATVLFVSSVPSTEVWWTVKNKKGKLKTFEPDGLAALQMIDLANYKPRRQASLSFPMSNSIQETLAVNGRFVLLLNRRGFSTTTRCNHCGHIVKCDRCNVSLTYLFSKKKLVCRLCNQIRDLPKECPQCQSTYLRYTGAGIEKLESELARIFPQARVARYDRETAEVPGEADVIIATQAVLKVLGRIRPERIGVLDIDARLNRFDFRSTERTLAYLVHLRQAAKEKVIVQSYHLDNYGIKAAGDLNFKKFYREETKLRRELGFPPFKHLIAVGLRGAKEEAVFDQAKLLFDVLEKGAGSIEVMDPHPDVLPKLRDKYRFTIMLKGASVARMQARIKTALKSIKRKSGVIITVNVDP